MGRRDHELLIETLRPECVIAPGREPGKRYAVSVLGRRVAAPAAAYEREYGRLPTGYDVHHLCRTKACTNVAHLSALTKSEHAFVHRLEYACEHGDAERDAMDSCRICKREGEARRTGGVPHIGSGGHQRAQTHCKRGHAYDEANTRWRRKRYGWARTCLACEAVSRDKHRDTRNAKRNAKRREERRRVRNG